MVLNASALPLHHSDLLVYTLYYRREETKYNRSEWCSGRALAFKPTGRGFAPRQSLSFSHVDVSIYQSYIGGLPPASALSFSHVDVGPTPPRPDVSCISYYRREETIYNRSEWCRGKALAFNLSIICQGARNDRSVWRRGKSYAAAKASRTYM